jgi:hypothetical protein
MRLRPVPVLLVVGVASVGAGMPITAVRAATPRVLRVGTWRGSTGPYRSIQSAVDAAHAGDWVLVGPGDWKERGDRTTHKPAKGEPGWGVTIETPGLHLRGMNRNTVVVDGTKPGTPKCSAKAADQDFGASSAGRSGIVAFKVNGVSIENLTACNYLGEGNQIWWNGGDGSGKIGMGAYHGAYLNATTTFYGGASKPQATYGIFVSNARGPGLITRTYASNMNDSSYYIGACPDCNAVLDRAWAENSALGYSGTNSGGHLRIQNSEWDDNQSGIVSNSQNNDDAPSPQDGACPGSTTTSCEIWVNNYVHDNNNPNVPQSADAAGAGPVGTGMVIAGGRHNTLIRNLVVGNKAWGILTVPYPDTEVPPADIGEHCQGGTPNFDLSALGQTGTVPCYFSDWGNEIAHNTFSNNGGYGNPTNGDVGDISQPAPEDPTATGNCWHDNTDTSGAVTESPSTLSTTNGSCPAPSWPSTNAAVVSVLIAEVACDSQLLFPCAPPPGVPASYPQTTKVQLRPLPTAKLATMPDPCKGVPVNPWCPAATSAGSGGGSAGGSGGSSTQGRAAATSLSDTGLGRAVPIAGLVLLGLAYSTAATRRRRAR